MLECNSPWLVNLVATARDDKNIFMLLEAVMGGELFAYLQVMLCGVQSGPGGGGQNRCVGLHWAAGRPGCLRAASYQQAVPCTSTGSNMLQTHTPGSLSTQMAW